MLDFTVVTFINFQLSQANPMKMSRYVQLRSIHVEIQSHPWWIKQFLKG